MLHRRTFITALLATAAGASFPKAAFAATRARFKLYDTHAHFFSNDLDRYPYKADINPTTKTRALAQPMTPDYLLKLWDDNGVEMGCGVQYNSTYSTDNRYLLDISAEYPKRIVPVVILSPTDPSTPATLAHLAKENHIAGVRFNGKPDSFGNIVFLSDAARGAWEAANDLGLVIVLILLKPDQPQAIPRLMGRIGEFANRYPNVKIVLDHVGFPEPVVTPTFGLSPQHLSLAECKNVYYKYTTFLIDKLVNGGVSPKDFLQYAVGVYGADRFIWGSDVGNSPGRYEDFVKAALDSADGLSASQQKAIFYNTAKALFIPGGRGPAHA